MAIIAKQQEITWQRLNDWICLHKNLFDNIRDISTNSFINFYLILVKSYIYKTFTDLINIYYKSG